MGQTSSSAVFAPTYPSDIAVFQLKNPAGQRVMRSNNTLILTSEQGTGDPLAWEVLTDPMRDHGERGILIKAHKESAFLCVRGEGDSRTVAMSSNSGRDCVWAVEADGDGFNLRHIATSNSGGAPYLSCGPANALTLSDKTGKTKWNFPPGWANTNYPGGNTPWIDDQNRLHGMWRTLAEDLASWPEHVGTLQGWVIDFNDSQDLVRTPHFDKVEGRLRERLSRAGDQHLFIFVHGVGTSFGPFRSYLASIHQLIADYRDKPGNAAAVSADNITYLGINWQSQEMGDMLMSLLHPGKKMPAEALAQGALPKVLGALLSGSNATVHFVAHSMGSRVLLHLLETIDGVRIGSMLFLQGFAPSSAFRAGAETDKKLVQNSAIQLFERFSNIQNWLYDPLNSQVAKIIEGVVSTILCYGPFASFWSAPPTSLASSTATPASGSVI